MTVPVRNPDIQHRAFGDEVLLFDGELLQRLTGSAAVIWQHLDDIRSRDQLITDLTNLYGTDPQVAQDVEAFLEQLTALGILSWADHAPRYEVPREVAWVQDAGRVVLADLRTGARTALSDTASLIWELAPGRTADEVASDLQSAYPDAPAAEVTGMLDQLVDQGLFSRVETAPPS